MNQENIRKIISTIVPLVEPDQIILFGSQARGDIHQDSDVDLLILKEGLTDEAGATNSIYYSFAKNNPGIATDLLTTDLHKYHQYKKTIGYVYKTIDEEGRLIYDAT